MAQAVFTYLDSAYYGFLGLPLLILWIEPHKQLFLLYLLICVVLGGMYGLAVGVSYWFLFGVVRLVMDFFGADGMMRIRGDRV